ncbi:hypothetical protein NL676_032407 [Syzygium grande]|nr:hypothetical protein NL676_032407 [Syzygium grande]
MGSDVKWRSTFACGVHHPIATLHLCIVTLLPRLRDRSHPTPPFSCSMTPSVTRLVGIRIASDKVKLSDEYGLEMEMAVDLGKPAAKKTNRRESKRMGLTS